MKIRVVAAAILHHNEVLAARRKSGEWAGFWELPGGKVEPGESDESALTREIQEELGLDISVGALLGEYDFPNFNKPMTLVIYFARTTQKTPRHLTDHDQAEWVPLSQLHRLKWAPADEPAVAILAGLPA